MKDFAKIETFRGLPTPLGLSVQGEKLNFAIFAKHATQVFLGLFLENDPNPKKEFPLHRLSGDVWHIELSHVPKEAEYAYRFEGPEGHGLLYHSGEWLADPYTKFPASPKSWGERPKHRRSFLKFLTPFDWQNDHPPKHHWEDLIFYEMHIRGFTRHPSSKTTHPGTFQAALERLDYIVKLGVTAVKLMPIYEFDETHCLNIDPTTHTSMNNYWGYSPIYYFAPMRRYCATDDAAHEFKLFVRECHKRGIEVFLDVVYNHTGEGRAKESTISFRGIDNAAYYIVDDHGHYKDYTGCGNTVNVNHPIVQDLIVDSLRYWVDEMHIDGFRFDLASIFFRGTHGEVLASPPLLHRIDNDPVLRNVKMIAEPWDCGGLYQVGSFAPRGWSEWNGPYRDEVRSFIKGDGDKAGAFAGMISGSEHLYKSSGTPSRSINFITAHDGYCLRDLVSYQDKHNYANGEENRDGNQSNVSWNCGAEGETSDPSIHELRERQMRNFLLTLFTSQGVPMLLMGDEYGHTRRGNNNPYVQDNEINWYLWDMAEQNSDQINFVSSLIAFRKEHSILRHSKFLTAADIDWHGQKPQAPNWSTKLVAFTLKKNLNPALYLAFNADTSPVTVTLPDATSWHRVVDTSLPWKDHFLRAPTEGPLLKEFTLKPYSSLLAAAK